MIVFLSIHSQLVHFPPGYLISHPHRIFPDVPSWVSLLERDAEYLFVSPLWDWLRLVIVLSLPGLILLIALRSSLEWPLLRCLLTPKASPSAIQPTASAQHNTSSLRSLQVPLTHSSLESTPNSGPILTGTLRFQRHASSIMLKVAMVSVVCLLPLYFAAANLFTCGRPLAKLSLAYLHQSRKMEWVTALMTCIYTTTASVAVLQLLREGHACFESPVSHPGSEAPPRDKPEPRLREYVNCGDVLRVSVWILALLFLNIPVLFYVLVGSLPEDNVLGIGHSGSVSIGYLVNPFVFFATDSILLPILCRWVSTRWANGEKGSTAELTFLVVSRFFLVILLPVVSVFVFDDNCLATWRLLWNPCRSHTSLFDVESEFFSSETRHIYVLTTQQVCTPTYRLGRCSRRVIALNAEMLVLKLAIEATLRPAFILLVTTFASIRNPLRRTLENYLRVSSLASIQVISWFEVGVLYGYAAPLVALLAALAIWTNCLVSHVIASSRGLVDASGSLMPIWHLPVSLMLLGGLVVWFFSDNTLHGSMVVVCVVPVILCATFVKAVFKDIV